MFRFSRQYPLFSLSGEKCPDYNMNLRGRSFSDWEGNLEFVIFQGETGRKETLILDTDRYSRKEFKELKKIVEEANKKFEGEAGVCVRAGEEIRERVDSNTNLAYFGEEVFSLYSYSEGSMSRRDLEKVGGRVRTHNVTVVIGKSGNWAVLNSYTTSPLQKYEILPRNVYLFLSSLTKYREIRREEDKKELREKLIKISNNIKGDFKPIEKISKWLKRTELIRKVKDSFPVDKNGEFKDDEVASFMGEEIGRLSQELRNWERKRKSIMENRRVLDFLKRVEDKIGG